MPVTHTSKPTGNQSYSERDSVYCIGGSVAFANWTRTSCELTNPDIEQDSRYRMRFGKNCERVGIVTPDGYMIRDIYIEHSGDRKRPFWSVSPDQHEYSSDEKKSVKAKIIRLWEEEHNILQNDIATEVERSQSYVSQILNKYKPYATWKRTGTAH
jgi:hypothetical protein